MTGHSTVDISPYAEALASVPGRERQTVVAGVDCAYWEYGGPSAVGTIVMIHGFRGDHHGLEAIIASLGGRHVIAPDLPGFGKSAAFEDRAHDIAGYAAWLGEFVSALGLEGPVTLLGHSFGSIVVAAALAGGLVAPAPGHVVLINPIGQNALRGPRAIGTALAVFYYWLGRVLPERLGQAWLRSRLIVRVMSAAMAKTRDRQLRAWIHEQHDAYFSSFANRTQLLEAFRASVSHDVSEFAASVTAPTLLIAAAQDDVTPLSAQRRLAALFPDARLEVIEGVGHLVHYETPLIAADLITRFVGDEATA